tara:strand:- start:185 stop:445 length:261 start_codon:yes stop_codon:yes gene_type:complete
MIFSEYKKILENNKIFLFDSYYRISYDRLIKLTSLIEKKQYGGGSMKKYVRPFYILKKSDRNKKIELLNFLLLNKKIAAFKCCKNL